MKRIIFNLILVITFASAQQVGSVAPAFTHQTLNDGTISLSDYQGKVVYLFFFGWG